MAGLQRVHHAVPDQRDRPGNDRQLVGVVLHADAPAAASGAFSEVHRGAPGDARGSSQNNLAAEFLGDYVYAAATRTLRRRRLERRAPTAADCPAVDAYRQALHDEAVATGSQTAEPEEPRGESAGEAEAEDRARRSRPTSSGLPGRVRQLGHLRGQLGQPVGRPDGRGARGAPLPGP